MPTLHISLETITLTLVNGSQDLPINLSDIMAIFTTLPPSELAWEKAIYMIEESISPLRTQLKVFNALTVTGDTREDLQRLPIQMDEMTGEKYISSETLELAFAVLAGYRPYRDLPHALPETKEFYATILLLREWVHHLDFERIYLA